MDRRAVLTAALSGASAPVLLAPSTTDIELARDWFDRYEGAGLDRIVAKPLDLPYRPDTRVMYKIKHERTADVVVAGYREHKSGPSSARSCSACTTPGACSSTSASARPSR